MDGLRQWMVALVSAWSCLVALVAGRFLLQGGALDGHRSVVFVGGSWWSSSLGLRRLAFVAWSLSLGLRRLVFAAWSWSSSLGLCWCCGRCFSVVVFLVSGVFVVGGCNGLVFAVNSFRKPSFFPGHARMIDAYPAI